MRPRPIDHVGRCEGLQLAVASRRSRPRRSRPSRRSCRRSSRRSIRSRTVSRPLACWRSTRSVAAELAGERLAAPQLVDLGLPAHRAMLLRAPGPGPARGRRGSVGAGAYVLCIDLVPSAWQLRAPVLPAVQARAPCGDPGWGRDAARPGARRARERSDLDGRPPRRVPRVRCPGPHQARVAASLCAGDRRGGGARGVDRRARGVGRAHDGRVCLDRGDVGGGLEAARDRGSELRAGAAFRAGSLSLSIRGARGPPPRWRRGGIAGARLGRRLDPRPYRGANRPRRGSEPRPACDRGEPHPGLEEPAARTALGNSARIRGRGVPRHPPGPARLLGAADRPLRPATGAGRDGRADRHACSGNPRWGWLSQPRSRC